MFVICIDIYSAHGLADKIITAKPEDKSLAEWLENVRRVSEQEHQFRNERKARKEASETNGT